MIRPVVVDADPLWPEQFIEIAGEITSRVGSEYHVEHIGSTAVPDLPGKAVVDLMFGLHRNKNSFPLFTVALTRAGFRLRALNGHNTRQIWSRRPGGENPNDSTVSANVHLVPTDSDIWWELILFRDWLRSDSGVAESYGSMKRKVEVPGSFDYTAYRAAKNEWMSENKESFLSYARSRGKDDPTFAASVFSASSITSPGGDNQDPHLKELEQNMADTAEAISWLDQELDRETDPGRRQDLEDSIRDLSIQYQNQAQEIIDYQAALNQG